VAIIEQDGQTSTDILLDVSGGSADIDILALQREKYQTRYNDALDEVTAASMALTELNPLLASAYANLRVLADSLYGRVHAIIVKRHGGVLKAIANAALLRPVWRLFKRSGLLLKLGIGIGLFNLWGYLFQAVVAGDVVTVLVIYGVVVAVLFFIERHIVLKAPLAMLKKNAAEFKKVRLSHIYPDQPPEVIKGQSALRGFRIASTDLAPVPQDDAFESSVGSGAYILGVLGREVFTAYVPSPKGPVFMTLLEKTFGSRSIDEPMWDYAVRTAREPGARFAPLAFLSAGLFSADIHTVYESLAMPVWMSHGVRGDFTDYRGKSIVEKRPNWRVTVYPTGALPYFERPAEFIADLEAFLGGPAR